MGEWIAAYWPQLVYWGITGALGAVCAWVGCRMHAWRTQQQAMLDGLQAILHDRIYQAHRYYMDKGYCPLDDKRNIEYLYKPYFALGGNGTGKQAYEDIQELPTQPDKGD